jgi:hypothetical protein
MRRMNRHERRTIAAKARRAGISLDEQLARQGITMATVRDGKVSTMGAAAVADRTEAERLVLQ